MRTLPADGGCTQDPRPQATEAGHVIAVMHPTAGSAAGWHAELPLPAAPWSKAALTPLPGKAAHLPFHPGGRSCHGSWQEVRGDKTRRNIWDEKMSDLTNSGAVLRRITFRSNPKELAVSVLRKSDRSVKEPNYLQNFLTGLSQRQALASAHDEPGTLLLCSKGTKIALFVSKCQHISVARRHKHQ